MRVLFLLAVTLALFQSTSSSFPVLMVNDLTDYAWKYYTDQGFQGWINFNVNGSLVARWAIPQAYWYYNAADNTVSFLNSAKGVTTKYSFMWRDYYGKWRLRGLSLVGTTNSHFLQQML